MATYKGVTRKYELGASRRRKDMRHFGQKVADFWNTSDGLILTIIAIPILALMTIKVPFAGEFLMVFCFWFYRNHIRDDAKAYDFPYRVPKLANVRDASTPGGKSKGKGVTFLGNESDGKMQIYAGDSDMRTHMLVLGTTGSGKTEFLLGLVYNAIIQNTGFIYVDGKGDPKLQKEIFRLCRMVGREDDLLVINFITSGRDFIEKQIDKVTNNMNIMGNSSAGMLIELIVSLMEDSGKGGNDMWKGRAIAFVSALARPLVYLRDKGFITLSPESFLSNFELTKIEELVFEHGGKYGEEFYTVVEPLMAYVVNLPGYDRSKYKKQSQETLQQHGYITMQLTRIFNDLNFNYGHIFKTNVGDIDFFDVVLNRRMLVVLLPALERAPDTLKMLGKMIVGSIKQMMAGCLGNKIEGVVREIIDSRPTNAPFPFYTILDEYGYYAVQGFAVAPAQARSLGFSMIFAAQDYSSLKKSSPEEADATWENTNIRAVGRLTSGQKSETWERIQGASGEAEEARLGAFKREDNDNFMSGDALNIDRHARLDYDDFAMQENGEITFLIGKKDRSGAAGGVRVIRGTGFYTASEPPNEMRINDFLPLVEPTPDEKDILEEDFVAYLEYLESGELDKTLGEQINQNQAAQEGLTDWQRFVLLQGNPNMDISKEKEQELLKDLDLATADIILCLHALTEKWDNVYTIEEGLTKRDLVPDVDEHVEAFIANLGVSIVTTAKIMSADIPQINFVRSVNVQPSLAAHWNNLYPQAYELYKSFWRHAADTAANTRELS